VVYCKNIPMPPARHDGLISKRHEGMFHAAEARHARHARLRHLATGVSRIASDGGGKKRETCSAAAAVNVMMSGLDYERAVLAAGPIGIEACMDVVMPLRARAQAVRRAIGTFQLCRARSPDRMCRGTISRQDKLSKGYEKDS